MTLIFNKLKGGNLRSIDDSNDIISEITNQREFDNLFEGLFNSERLIVMRSADAVEKITSTHPKYLDSHKKELLELFQTVNHIELKWHLAQLIPRLIIRLKLSEDETRAAWNRLTQWALDKSSSRIVRVNSTQDLFDIQKEYPDLREDCTDTLSKLDKENIPSIVTRIKKLRKQMKS